MTKSNSQINNQSYSNINNMSMFSGLGNQISGFVAQKMGKGEAPPEGEPQEVPLNENGEEVPAEPAGGAMGGAMGFAQGLMAKAAAAKEGIATQAGGLKVCVCESLCVCL